MRKIRITFEVPEDYEDIHPDLVVADICKDVNTAWVIVKVEDILSSS